MDPKNLILNEFLTDDFDPGLVEWTYWFVFVCFSFHVSEFKEVPAAFPICLRDNKQE